MPCSCYMGIDHGTCQRGMTEKLLDEPDIDTGLQEMSCVAMAKGVDPDPFLYLGQFLQHPAHRPLDGLLGHGCSGRGTQVAASAQMRLKVCQSRLRVWLKKNLTPA
jgi:hypothetical protein